jgi:hypothetical protein
MNTLAGLLVGAIFFLPIYLPFVLSFLIKSEDFREVRIALRFGSILALVGALIAMGSHKDYGDDVAGNLAGAVHNFFWVWGIGLLSLAAALLLGLGVRRFRIRRTGPLVTPPAQ